MKRDLYAEVSARIIAELEAGSCRRLPGVRCGAECLLASSMARGVSLMPRPSNDVFGQVIDERADVRRPTQSLGIDDP